MLCILGIDTSNYTTSVCAVAADSGNLLASSRKLLSVTQGERGLRQSDALFFHVRQLPEMMSDLMAQLHRQGVRPVWKSIGVTVRPRPHASSYMPVFQAGTSYASFMAQALGVPVVRTSHQENHIAAAEYFIDKPTGPFVAVHISGGTSDVMIAERTSSGYKINLVGEGMDLHAGQFVDRLGVRLGMPFPAGPHIEAVASERPWKDEFRLPSAVRGARMSFSGPLTEAFRALERGVPAVLVAQAAQHAVAQSVVKAIEHVVRHAEVDIQDAVIAGGVASNNWIREYVIQRLHKRLRKLKVQFAPAEYAKDNALGVACIAYRSQR